jgi:hypothetical protein
MNKKKSLTYVLFLFFGELAQMYVGLSVFFLPPLDRYPICLPSLSARESIHLCLAPDARGFTASSATRSHKGHWGEKNVHGVGWVLF